jgi:hypothetical protein
MSPVDLAPDLPPTAYIPPSIMLLFSFPISHDLPVDKSLPEDLKKHESFILVAEFTPALFFLEWSLADFDLGLPLLVPFFEEKVTDSFKVD